MITKYIFVIVNYLAKAFKGHIDLFVNEKNTVIKTTIHNNVSLNFNVSFVPPFYFSFCYGN